jgi:alpha-tubulin suppressor-like RCC1 family protein
MPVRGLDTPELRRTLRQYLENLRWPQRLCSVALSVAASSCAAAVAVPGAAAAPTLAASAWGANQYGQLGNGTETSSTVPVEVLRLGEVAQVASGERHSLARLSEGTLEAWGANEFGQLGVGTTIGPGLCLMSSFACSTTPVPVNKVSGVTQIAAGANFSLALLSNGTVMAWGQNSSGQLGDGTTESRDEPVEVSGLKEVSAIAAGTNHALAMMSTGKVEAWGANEFGQLGNGTTTASMHPVEVKGLTGVVSIAAGANHSLARKSNGTVRAWGDNASGQLGNGTTTNSPESTEVKGLVRTATAVAAGANHSAALLSNGTVKTWGANEFGQLGTGTTTASHEAVEVKNITAATAIAAGANHTLAVLSGGLVKAWGAGEAGQIGNGSNQAIVASPVEVDALSGITSVAAGGNHTLAVGDLAPIPKITHLEPNHGSAAGGNTVIITGTNLAEVTAVKFGSKSATNVKVESEIQVSATVPAGTGVVPVTVSTPEATSPLTLADIYTYGPTIATVLPDRGLPSGGTQVTLTGTRFSGVTAVKFGTQNAKSFTVEKETQIVATTPPGAPATVQVTVTNAQGTNPPGGSTTFQYTEPRWYKNLHITVEKSKTNILGFGQLTLASKNGEFSAECVNLMNGAVWNEIREPNIGNKGYGAIYSFFANGHAPTSEHTELGGGCRIVAPGAPAGTEGFITAEAPLHPVVQEGEVCIDRAEQSLSECPVKAGEPGAERELTSVVREVTREPTYMPWNVELIPAEGGIHVKIGLPNEKGKSCNERPAPPGCVHFTVVVPALGWQVPLEGSFEPNLLVGISNALAPSILEFEGEKSGTLSSGSSPFGTASITGGLKFFGFNSQEMVSAE